MCTIIQRDCVKIVRLVQSVETTKELINTQVREQFLMSDGKVCVFFTLITENGPISHPLFHETCRVPLRFTNIRTYSTALQIGYKSQYYRTNINIVTETHFIHMTPGLFAIIVDIRTFFLLVTMMRIKLEIFTYWTTVVTLVFIRSPLRSQPSSRLLKINTDLRIERQIMA